MSVAVGVDLREGGRVAVAADGEGRIVARSVKAPGASALGIAVRNPLDPSVTSAAASVVAESGMSTPPRILTRGTAIALAEQWLGAARGAQHVVALSLDESVHAGIVVGGRPFAGAHGLAGAAGWLALNPVEREDYRKLGCLEAEIGTAGIVRRLVWRIKSGDRSRVLDAANGDINAITIGQVFAGARDGDGVAISVVRDTAKYIGMAIANLAAVVDPEVVIVTGAIADAADLLLEPSRTEAARRLPSSIGGAMTIAAGTLGDDAAPLGAARVATLAP